MDNQLRSMRIQSVFLLVALAVQYALGMYVNLFVSFPDGVVGDTLWEFAWSQPALAAHIILAILILLGALVLCVRAFIYKSGRWITASLIGLVGVLAAGASGAIFIPSQTDLYSYAMSLCFLIAFLAYSWVLISTKPRELVS